MIIPNSCSIISQRYDPKRPSIIDCSRGPESYLTADPRAGAAFGTVWYAVRCGVPRPGIGQASTRSVTSLNELVYHVSVYWDRGHPLLLPRIFVSMPHGVVSI